MQQNGKVAALLSCCCCYEQKASAYAALRVCQCFFVISASPRVSTGTADVYVGVCTDSLIITLRHWLPVCALQVIENEHHLLVTLLLFNALAAEVRQQQAQQVQQQQQQQ
jgi:hypothetical protein